MKKAEWCTDLFDGRRVKGQRYEIMQQVYISRTIPQKKNRIADSIQNWAHSFYLFWGLAEID